MKRKTTPDGKIQCVHVDYDLDRVGPVLSVFHVKWFDGEKGILYFPICPLRYWVHYRNRHGGAVRHRLARAVRNALLDEPMKRQDETMEAAFRRMLIARGRLRVSLELGAKMRHMNYSGHVCRPIHSVMSCERGLGVSFPKPSGRRKIR